MDDTPTDLNFKGQLIDDATRQADLDLHREKSITTLNYMAAAFAKGRDYSNFILAAGYAAFFALWTGVAADIDKPSRLLSGALLGASLITFIVWELLKAYETALEGDRLHRAIWDSTSREELAAMTRTLESDLATRSVILNNLWPMMFIFSSLTGLVGGIVLVIAMIGHYLALP